MNHPELCTLESGSFISGNRLTESLMDAFIGTSRNRKNSGLFNVLWKRLFGEDLPPNLIRKVECGLNEASYTKDRFFDLRMGIKLDEDRWAAEAGSNYKLETLCRNATFDFKMLVDDALMKKADNTARLFYLLEELRNGRFWFGAGKSKGMGRCRLEIKLPFAPAKPPAAPPPSQANHLRLVMEIDAANPLLINWPWGKVDQQQVKSAPTEGQLLLETLAGLPPEVRERLEMGLSGPVLEIETWKQKLQDTLPRVLVIWFQDKLKQEKMIYTLPSSAVASLGKGKYGLPKDIMANIRPLADKDYTSVARLEEDIKIGLGKKANMLKRVIKEITQEKKAIVEADPQLWRDLAGALNLDTGLEKQFVAASQDDAEFDAFMRKALQPAWTALFTQIDHQIKLLQSDYWVDEEIQSRQEHLKIKEMLRDRKIHEEDWYDQHTPPKGVRLSSWQEFLQAHAKVAFKHLLNATNLNKSIVNDQNHIEFLQNFRNKTRLELSQPCNTDFRAGGPKNRHISRDYGKSYDNLFMRMLSWVPARDGQPGWEVYIPGSTIKGALRKRASQILKTLEGAAANAQQTLDRLFGAQGKRGAIFFSDAYLSNPEDTDRAWCSMDGIRVDARTGKPQDETKRDYLYAYGRDFMFQLQIDIQDLEARDAADFTLLLHLLQDFQNGDVPLGGQKTSGQGWVEARPRLLEWRALQGPKDKFGQQFFADGDYQQDGLWWKKSWQAQQAVAQLAPGGGLALKAPQLKAEDVPLAREGFVSHRAYGGFSGRLFLQAEVMTPLHIQESGEPSHTRMLANDEPVNGWDFFSCSPPEAQSRPAQRTYALPPKSLRGLIRHIYSIASNVAEAGPNISNLNAVDQLFGWVGVGPNQALAGRMAIDMGYFDNARLSWFTLPYPYGHNWFENGKWVEKAGEKGSRMVQVADKWRLFPHSPLAPVVRELSEFTGDEVSAFYFRAMLPGSTANFSIRFWNLREEELQKLIWCLVLESDLAHKLGAYRYLGLGSLRFRLLPESHLIDWGARYIDAGTWKMPLDAAQWAKTAGIKNYPELKKHLYAGNI
jgi:CRISPR/Cas system CSM-associated protein Csm3 (group 7 of RAMP superfamily)